MWRFVALGVVIIAVLAAGISLIDTSGEGEVNASPSLERFATDVIPYTAEERTSLHSDNVSDTFIIYRVKRAGDAPQLPGHDREVRVTVPDLGADMVV